MNDIKVTVKYCANCKHYDYHISVPTNYPIVTSRCLLDDKKVTKESFACEKWEADE